MASKHEPTKEQRAALKNQQAAKLMVMQLNRETAELRDEVKTLKKSIKKLQDEAEKYRAKNHSLDKQNAVLKSRHNGFASYETIQGIVSFGVSGFGFYLLPTNRLAGGAFVCGAVVIYIVLAVIQKRDMR